MKYTGFAAQILQSGFWLLICVPQNAQKLKLMMLIFSKHAGQRRELAAPQPAQTGG